MAQTNSARLVFIEASITAIETLLADLWACPKPTYTSDAQTFKWSEYKDKLMSDRKELQAEYDFLTDIEGGFGFEETQVFVEG